MEQPIDKQQSRRFRIPVIWRLYIVGGILLIIIGGLFVKWLLSGSSISLGGSGKTTMSPTQIQLIESIGEWEFLSISDEELVDTVRHGFFGDDELVRIYYGTLRLGVDFKNLREGWVTTKGDSLVCTLPAVKLLDEHFIDETRTISFYESGKWSAKDRSDLYDRAYSRMRQRCLTPGNLERTEENARVQFLNFLRSMGYTNVIVKFEGES